MLNLNFNIIGSKSFEQERGDGYNPFPVQILLVGGGGGGGGVVGSGQGTGGGAGGFISASWTIPALTIFDVIVGDGGEVGILANPGEGNEGIGGNGGDTKLVVSSTSEVVFNAIGGGGGVRSGISGQSGGSSGGTNTAPAIPLTPCIIPSNATLAQRTGSLGGVSNINAGAAGGGVLTNGADGSVTSINPAGGNGISTTFTFISGAAVPTVLSPGGNGAARDVLTTAAAPLSGSGGGGHAGVINLPPPGVPNNRIGTPGASGLFAIRYAGLPKATGGIITQADGFTTHLFTSSSQLVVGGRNNSTP